MLNTNLELTQLCRYRMALLISFQDWSGDLVENGMFYFARRKLVLESGLLQGGERCAYVEVPQELSLEIDSPLDLAFARQESYI
jgi:CMP-N-acetylneuraminic acid synthetase